VVAFFGHSILHGVCDFKGHRVSIVYFVDLMAESSLLGAGKGKGEREVTGMAGQPPGERSSRAVATKDKKFQ
jgi:hypothetical protein